jgi:hypothetical protein
MFWASSCPSSGATTAVAACGLSSELGDSSAVGCGTTNSTAVTNHNQHVDQITTKLCSACYALSNLKRIVPQSTLQTIYYAYIHSILSYGIIFWGRSSNVSKLFILQKRIIRIINNTGVRESCREAFKNMEIMTYSQYIFSSILFAVKNKNLFTSNNEIFCD